MMVLGLSLELKFKRVNVTSIFLHENMEEGGNSFVKIPRGFQKKGKMLKMLKMLHGLRQYLVTFGDISIINRRTVVWSN